MALETMHTIPTNSLKFDPIFIPENSLQGPSMWVPKGQQKYRIFLHVLGRHQQTPKQKCLLRLIPTTLQRTLGMCFDF